MTSRVLRKREEAAPPVEEPAEGFPEDPAVTVLEKLLHKLSKQAIPHDNLADADAALVQTMFASQQFETRKDPICPIGPSKILLSTEQRMRMKMELRLAFNYPEDDRLLVCGEAFADRVMAMGIPALSRPKLKVALSQYVSLTLRICFQLTHTSLAIRYTLLEREDSNLKLARVYFPGCSEASLGVVAAEDIPNATYILRSATNAASTAKHDFSNPRVMARVDDGMKISLMTPSAAMTGPKVVRIMLGPLRFVNHACHPNTMVRGQSSARERALIFRSSCALQRLIRSSCGPYGTSRRAKRSL
jgi:hypothetical protein